ncbi:MAG: hypothetical protein JOZ11_08560 [Alphaproteobacteria bacterium]|nr:hypothetical protein [Alphaproteobacteria bacterium]
MLSKPSRLYRLRAPSSPKVRAESVFGVAGAGPNKEMLEFPDVDPSGAPLPDRHVSIAGNRCFASRRSALNPCRSQKPAVDAEKRTDPRMPFANLFEPRWAHHIYAKLGLIAGELGGPNDPDLSW